MLFYMNLTCLGIGNSGGLFQHGNETLDSTTGCEFLISWATISFSRKVLFNGVYWLYSFCSYFFKN